AGGTGVRAGAGGLSGGGGVSGSGVSGAGGRADADPDGLLTSTQVLPRIDPAHGPTVVGPRAPEPGPGPLRGLRALRPVRGAYDGEFADPEAETEAEFDQSARAARGGDSVRHAWYPGRR